MQLHTSATGSRLLAISLEELDELKPYCRCLICVETPLFTPPCDCLHDLHEYLNNPHDPFEIVEAIKFRKFITTEYSGEELQAFLRNLCGCIRCEVPSMWDHVLLKTFFQRQTCILKNIK